MIIKHALNGQAIPALNDLNIRLYICVVSLVNRDLFFEGQLLCWSKPVYGTNLPLK